MIPHTHGGWIPPQEPSASCRSRIHRSATATARRRSAFGRRGGSRLARPRADRRQVDVCRAHGAQRLRDRERDERLPRPAGEVVDRERRSRRQEDELGRDRRHPLPRPLAEQRHEALREQPALRDAALALDVRERLRPRVDAARAGTRRRPRSRWRGRAAPRTRSTTSRRRASSRGARSRSAGRAPACAGRGSGARRGAAPSSSRSTRARRPRCRRAAAARAGGACRGRSPGRGASARRWQPSSSSNSGGSAAQDVLSRRGDRCGPRSPSSPASRCRSTCLRGRRRGGRSRLPAARRPAAARPSRTARGSRATRAARPGRAAR